MLELSLNLVYLKYYRVHLDSPLDKEEHYYLIKFWSLTLTQITSIRFYFNLTTIIRQCQCVCKTDQGKQKRKSLKNMQAN